MGDAVPVVPHPGGQVFWQQRMADELDVRIFATLRLRTGVAAVAFPRDASDQTVRDVVRWLDGRLGVNAYDELIDAHGAIRPGTMLLLDGRNVHHLQGLDTPLSGARLDVFPPSGGG